jgi:hypothetical protein
MGLLYGRAGRLTAKNGGFRPGQGTEGGRAKWWRGLRRPPSPSAAGLLPRRAHTKTGRASSRARWLSMSTSAAAAAVSTGRTTAHTSHRRAEGRGLYGGWPCPPPPPGSTRAAAPPPSARRVGPRPPAAAPARRCECTRGRPAPGDARLNESGQSWRVPTPHGAPPPARRRPPRAPPRARRRAPPPGSRASSSPASLDIRRDGPGCQSPPVPLIYGESLLRRAAHGGARGRCSPRRSLPPRAGSTARSRATPAGSASTTDREASVA